MATKKVPIIAIVGRANVGKSSLFNAVLHRREAIVANEPGTTRDSVIAKASYDGQDFWLVDTAGMKDPEDDFEFTIQEQITQAADSADVIWVVIEADTVITEEDRRVATLALKSRKPVFLIVNKMDQTRGAKPQDFQKLGIKPIFLTSVTQGRGVTELLSELIVQIPKASIKVASDRLHLAILGRPNVGKSNLFNTLAKKQQAIVADRAGTTRDINRTTVKFMTREIELLDTAGIRRSGKIERGVERFSVIRSLSAIEQSDICLLLMDVNELSVQLDQKIAGLIKDAGKGLIIVVTKWDTLDDTKTPYTRDQLAGQIKHEFAFVPWAPLIFTSAVTGQNVTTIFELVLEIEQARKKLITTSELNRWLRSIVNAHPPAGLKNRNPKLNYIVQESENPTNFKVYGAHTKFLHWSYKRYMDRQLRAVYGFGGMPIRFWFFDKSVDSKGPIIRKQRTATRSQTNPKA
ncbi:MAG TPA: ribosome biogenesis GTPase Der [Patescibacteria group bacterium]|nr:ribosome biogenesis GTPase Der [Patescibacteria group bacterium]